MQSAVHSVERFDVHRAITDKIASAIEAGAGEFVMPWHRQGPSLGRPANAVSRMKYRGVNVVVLWAEAVAKGFKSGWWATYEQWKTLGAQVRQGERGTTIVFYKPRSPSGAEDEDAAREEPRLLARAFRVFNADQVAGWNAPEVASSSLPEILEQVEGFVSLTKATIIHGGDEACYVPAADHIEMPARERFVGSPTCTPTEAYYSTLLHELTHWSGAKHRLNRELGKRFGTEAYAMEELIAELGAAFLCADLGIVNEPRADHAAYLATWLKVLSADRRAIFTAAKQASEAAAYLGSFVGD